MTDSIVSGTGDCGCVQNLHYADSGSKWHQKHKMAAPISRIFWLQCQCQWCVVLVDELNEKLKGNLHFILTQTTENRMLTASLLTGDRKETTVWMCAQCSHTLALLSRLGPWYRHTVSLPDFTCRSISLFQWWISEAGQMIRVPWETTRLESAGRATNKQARQNSK